MSNIKAILRELRVHAPYIIAVVLVCMNALIANGDITIAPHTLDLINAVLAALGLGVLHKRQA